MSAKIYCIECLETGEKYIGSTIQRLLSKRIAYHKYRKSCVSRQIIDRGKYKYYLLEEVDESQKLIREQYYIDNTDCINKYRAYGFNKKEYHKEYRELNKDKLKEYDKEYRELNKEKIKEFEKNRYKFKCSWGGLLSIHPSLFCG